MRVYERTKQSVVNRKKIRGTDGKSTNEDRYGTTITTRFLKHYNSWALYYSLVKNFYECFSIVCTQITPFNP